MNGQGTGGVILMPQALPDAWSESDFLRLKAAIKRLPQEAQRQVYEYAEKLAGSSGQGLSKF